MIEGDELKAYLKSLAEYHEIKNITNTAFSDGKRKGEYEEKLEMANIMLKKGFDVVTIAEIMKLTVQEIEELK